MSKTESNLPVLHVPQDIRLPDNDQYTNRFHIHSATSDRIYVVAQHKKRRNWSCSCPGWRAHRKCRHLTEIGVPNGMVPYEATLKGGN